MNANIPSNFEDWKYCITQKCGLKFNPVFVRQRIQTLENTDDPQTLDFIRLYGKAHWENVLMWFKMVL